MQRSTRQGNTIRRLASTLSALVLLCAVAALAQTPATPAPALSSPPAPVTQGAAAAAPANTTPLLVPDPVAQLQALRDAAHRNQMLSELRKAAAAPMVSGPVEQESETPAPGEKPQPGKFGDEGIHVHGHWVIDVKNPDGTLAGHHDFQNSLQGGGFVLAGMLNGEFVPANWMIVLSGSPPICAGGSSVFCGIVQSLTTLPAVTLCTGGYATCVTGLTTAFNYSAPPISFVLAGSFTATQSGSINQVSTELGYCFTAPGATFSPQSCAVGYPSGGSNGLFSAANITAIPVASGQTVLVTVTFTFS